MDASLACEALREGRCLALRYAGYSRVVEVHAVGRSQEDALVMRAWQVRGGSASDAPFGWKLLRLDAIRSAHVIDETSAAPRPGFKRKDPAMGGGILCTQQRDWFCLSLVWSRTKS